MHLDLQNNNNTIDNRVSQTMSDIGKPNKTNDDISSTDIDSSQSVDLLDIEALKKKLRQTENKMCSIIAVMSETDRQVRMPKSKCYADSVKVWHNVLAHL